MTPPTHPEFAQHGTFEHLKLGRKPAAHDPRTLTLAKYLDDAVVLPTIPDEYDYAAAVPSWPMYGNDRLGDCTCAAVGHMIQAWSAAQKNELTPADADVELLYWETGDPAATTGEAGGPTDDGRVEISILNYWRQTGVGGDKIAAYVAVDPSNVDHVKAAIYLFGGVYTGVALPLTAQGQAVWDVNGDPSDENSPAAPGSWGGHAVPFVAYDGGGVALVTWGGVVRATWAFHGAYTDELYAIVSNDFLAADVSPEGFDLAALQADLAALEQAQQQARPVEKPKEKASRKKNRAKKANPEPKSKPQQTAKERLRATAKRQAENRARTR